jgi:hypothetical protein
MSLTRNIRKGRGQKGREEAGIKNRRTLSSKITILLRNLNHERIWSVC